MSDHSVVLLGLPASGKTTYLAALWHLVTSNETETALRLARLGRGSLTYLNGIAKEWREARVQARTRVQDEMVVRMEFVDRAGCELSVTFPDLSGESFKAMWGARACSKERAELLRAPAVILSIHASAIDYPMWLLDEMRQTRELGIPPHDDKQIDWQPDLAPTQVQIVDLLQLLRTPPLDVGPRRLLVMLSAWDTAEGEGLAPEAYLKDKLPLVHQYLQARADGWDRRAIGVSAQGGEYDTPGTDTPLPQAQALRGQDKPSERIRCVGAGNTSHDLTEPLQWLMS